MIFLCNLIKIQNRLDAFPVALHNIAREDSVFSLHLKTFGKKRIGYCIFPKNYDII